jgi:hypothetical protein
LLERQQVEVRAAVAEILAHGDALHARAEGAQLLHPRIHEFAARHRDCTATPPRGRAARAR